MQLVLKNGMVIATHPDGILITDEHYPDCDIVDYEGMVFIGEVPFDDPRTEEEKKEFYRSKRRRAYPKIGDQLDMIYWDKVNGTSIWQQTIATVKARYPKR